MQRLHLGPQRQRWAKRRDTEEMGIETDMPIGWFFFSKGISLKKVTRVSSLQKNSFNLLRFRLVSFFEESSRICVSICRESKHNKEVRRLCNRRFSFHECIPRSYISTIAIIIFLSQCHNEFEQFFPNYFFFGCALKSIK